MRNDFKEFLRLVRSILLVLIGLLTFVSLMIAFIGGTRAMTADDWVSILHWAGYLYIGVLITSFGVYWLNTWKVVRIR